MRRLLAIVPAMLACLALVPASAAAAAVVEDFETPALADGAAVGDQFRPSSGISFTANLQDGIHLPEIDIGGAPLSPTRTLDMTTAGVEFPTPGLEGRFDTVVTDLTVSVRNLYTSDAELRLDAYGQASGSKSTGWVTIPPATWVELTVPQADPGNSYFKFQLLSRFSAGYEIRVDDITFEPDPAAADNYSLLTEDIGGVVLAGEPKRYTIDVQRLNGFAGDVALSAESTVSGETIEIGPNPVSGESATLTMTLPPDTPDRTGEVLTITGSGAPGERTLTIPFVVESPHSITTSAPAGIEVPPCSTAELEFRVDRHRFSDRPVSLDVVRFDREPLPADLDVSITPASIDGSGVATVHVTRSDSPADPAPLHLVIVASNGTVERYLHFNVHRAAPSLTSIAPAVLSAPEALRAGSTIAVRGAGLCPGARIRFGNSHAEAPARRTAAPTRDDPAQVQLTAATPRLATSGPITVINPSGTRVSSAGAFPDRTVDAYRSRFGFSFPNEDGIWEDHDGDGTIDAADEPRPAGAGSLRDWQELLGPRQTNLNACQVGAIFPFCWEVITPVPSIEHLIMQTVFGEATLYNRGGTCLGLALASRRIATGRVAVRGRPAGGAAAPVWSLRRSGRETIPGRTDIPLERRQQLSPIKYAAIQHAAQLTAEYVELVFQRRLLNATAGPGPMRAAIERHLRAGRRPLLNVNWDGGGHVVNVYDVEDRPGGGYYLRVYDNNHPYLASEAANGSDHALRARTRSRIEITPGGAWKAPGIRRVTARNAAGQVTATAPREGPTGDLSWVAVETELPEVPTSLASLDGLRVLATPTFGSALEARAAQAGESGLLELGYLDGEGSMLLARSDRGHRIPVARGSGSLAVFGEGSTAEVRARRSAGHVLLSQGSRESIGFKATGRSARVGLTLVSEAGRMVRIRGARRGTTRIRLAGKRDAVRIAHRGAPGKIRLELAGFGDRARAGRVSTTLRLDGKGKATLAPRWSRLGRRLVAKVDGHRRVLRDRSRPPVRVQRVGLRAVQEGSRARARVRARLRGRAGRLRALTVTVELRSGRRVVARRTKQLEPSRRSVRRLAKGLRLGLRLDRGRRGRLSARATVTASAGGAIPLGSSESRRRRVRRR